MTAPFTHPAEPNVSPEAITRFVDTVFGYLDGFVPVRAFAEKGTPDKPSVLKFHQPGQLAEALIRMAPKAADHARGLYVVPATVALAGGRASLTARHAHGLQPHGDRGPH